MNMMSDYLDNKKHQMRPIARNLKAPQPPRFTSGEDSQDFPVTTFRSNVTIFQTPKKVRISHYEKGCNLFYVQLESQDRELQSLMDRVQGARLVKLNSRPNILGMACLAKLNRKLYRVAIAKTTPESQEYNCHFVDLGFTSPIKFENLYYIPSHLLKEFTFAFPFALSGLKNCNFKASSDEIDYYFRTITENKLLSLKCQFTRSIDSPICQSCELYDNETNILDLLKSFNPSDIKCPPQKKLELKKKLPAIVCYVESAQQFYVHLQDSDTLFSYDTLYYNLQKGLPQAPVLTNFKTGDCCAVRIDTEWFRAEIVKSNGTDVEVRIIDFGIIEKLPAKSIRLLCNKYTELPSFAYRCCLKGFEKTEVSDNITTQFEIFCENLGQRKVFNMHVDDSFGDNCYLVELEDESIDPPANVNRILLKNSRPLAETITLENAKKRLKERRDMVVQEVREIKSPDKNSRSNSQRGRRNQVGKGNMRSSPTYNSPGDSNNKRQRTHFGKNINFDNTNSTAGTFYKPKEQSVWGSNDTNVKQNKPSDWNQAKNITRELNSDSDWNDTDKSAVKKTKSSGKSKKRENESQSKQKVRNEKNSNASRQEDKSAKKSENMKCGWVSTLCTVQEAFVHYEENVDDLEKILDQMFAFYENQDRPFLKEMKEGMICAMRSQDANWYRCKIEALDGKQIRALNLEYGNTEYPKQSDLRVLDEQFAKIPNLVVKVYFTIKPNEAKCDSQKLLLEMKQLFNDGIKEFSFKVVKPFRQGVILEPIDPETSSNILDTLVSRKMAVRITEKELAELLDTKNDDISKKAQNATPIGEEKVNEKVSVIEEKAKTPEKEISEKEAPVPVAEKKKVAKLSALTSPTNFYLVNNDQINSFTQMHNNIQILAPAMQPLLDFECETFCLAKSLYDNQWYRAKIIDSDDEQEQSIITVMLIDNGKTFSIDNKFYLRSMPEPFIQKKFFAMECSLPIKLERRCEEEATELMLKMVEKEVEFDVTVSGSQLSFVEIFFNNENIADLLVKKGLAKRIEVFESGTGYTSHINSIDDFYVQLEKDQLKLDLISSIIDGKNGNFENVKDPKVGQFVAAKFPEDECWYRSCIERVEKDGFTVKFIDYGNSCFVKEIGFIDNTICELPAMSKHCALRKPKSISNFSDAAEQKFIEICANGATILDIKISKPGETSDVELFIDDENISKTLIPLCSDDMKKVL